MANTITVYIGFDSPALVELKKIDGSVFTAADMEAITHIKLRYTYVSGATVEEFDSDIVAHAGVFDWATYASTGRLVLDLGLMTITVGRDEKAELIVYDATYTNGRVVKQLDLYVTDQAGGSGTNPPAYSAPLTVIDDYDILTTDFSRTAIRMNAATSKTATLPVITEAMDGKQIPFEKQGAGNAVLAAGAGNTIGDATDTQMTGTSTYATILVRANYATGCWVVCGGIGKWQGA